MITRPQWLTFVVALLSISILPSVSFGAVNVHLAWNASQGDVTGYRIYYGTSEGNYPNMRDVGDATDYAINDLDEGVTYYFVVRAYNDYGESGNSNVVQWPEPELSISISTPATNPYSTTHSTLATLSGTAYGHVAIDHVAWKICQGDEEEECPTGEATGTSQWSVSNIPLHCGLDNVITVTVHDTENNISTDSITIDVKPCPPATVGFQ